MVADWLDIYMVVCSNIGTHELSFLFAKISSGMNVKGQKP